MVPKAGQLIREALERYDRECASNETTQCMQELIDKVARLARTELVLSQKVQQLEQAGDRMAKRLCLIINSERTPDNASIDAVKNWWKIKEESE